MTTWKPVLLLCLLWAGTATAQFQKTPGPGHSAPEVAFVRGTTVLLGVHRQGVFLSSDHGGSWVAASGTAGTTPLCFAANPTHVYVGLDALYGPGGVYRSSDGGASWQPSSTGLGSRRILALLAEGTSTIYAGDSTEGVFRSTDGGASWAPANSGIQTESIGALARTSTRLLAAGTNNLYESTDGGASWAFTNGGQYFPIAGMAAFGNLVLAGGFQGLMRSTDGGASFGGRIDVFSIESTDRLTSFAQSGSTIYASTRSSPGSGGAWLIRSTDSGATWVPTQPSVPRIAIGNVVLDGTRLVAAAPDKGVLLSTDGGATFSRSVAGIPYGGNVRALSRTQAGPLLPLDLYAATQGDGVYVTRNAGSSWAQASADPTGRLQHETVLSLLAESQSVLAGTAYRGVFRSTDRGGSWSPSNGGLPSGVVQAMGFARAGTNVLVGTQGGLYYSANDGASWSASSLQGGTIVGLAAADGYAYAAFVSGLPQTNGIYRSQNGGVSWTRVYTSDSTSYVSGMSAAGSHVYAGIFVGGMLGSQDHGTTWQRVDPGGGVPVYSVLAKGLELYAGTDPVGARVYRSVDHGSSWQPYGIGLPAQAVEALESARYIYAGTEEEGVWRRSRAIVP